MAELFGTDIAGQISTAFSGNLIPATLTRQTGTYDPITDTTTPGEPEVFTSEGVVTGYSKKMIAEGLVESNDRQILLIAQPLGTTPEPGDTIEIESKTFTVVAVDKDPATATYTVQGRL